MDRGHFRERTVDVATMSGSAALEITGRHNVSLRMMSYRLLFGLTFADNRLFGQLLSVFDFLAQFLNRDGFDDVDHEVEGLGLMLAMSNGRTGRK